MADINQSFLSQPVPQPAGDSIELSGLGKVTTLLGQMQNQDMRNTASGFDAANLAGLTSNLNRVQGQNQEWASAPFAAARLAGANKDTIVANETAKQAPYETTIKAEEARQAPSMASAKIAEANDKIALLKDAPRTRVAQRLASHYEEINSEKNPILQAQKYQTVMQDLINSTEDPQQRALLQSELGNPAKGMAHLKMAYQESVNTADQIKKLQQEAETGKWHLKAAQASAGGTIEAARIHAKASKEIAELNASAPKQAAALMAAARLKMIDPKTDDLQRAVATEVVKASVEADVMKEAAARQIEILQGKTSVDAIRQAHYQRAGIYGVTTPNANPNPASTPPATPAVKVPKVGDVLNGYKFKGGNPADKTNWEKQ